MFHIDVMSRKAVYEQLVDQVERFILTGALKTDERIPSVRSMSTSLSVNPNTIQKAYQELDRRGDVYSVAGRGCFVSPHAKQRIGERKREDLNDLIETLRELALAGIEKETILQCVQEAFDPHGFEKMKEQAEGGEQR